MSLSLATPARHSYSVYGVRVVTDAPFDLPASRAPWAADGAASVAFASGCDDDFPFAVPADAEFICEELPDGRVYLRWRGWYDFVVAADGSRVVYRPLDGCDRAVFHNFLFSQVLGIALVRRGLEPLHASVVEVGDSAIGFLGDCTYGKSTLLASFLERGYRAVTDDMLIVERRAGEPHAIPGAGRIKLLPDSAGRFLAHAGRGALLNRMTAKRLYRLDAGSRCDSSLPLRTLYILPDSEERDASASIEIPPASRAEMVRELVKNTFIIHLVDRDRMTRQFAAATQLASEVDGFRLRYPTGLHHLPALRDRIVEHAVNRSAPRALRRRTL